MCIDDSVRSDISDCVQISRVVILFSSDTALDCLCAEHMHDTSVGI